MGLAFYSQQVVKSQEIGAIIRAAREAADISQQGLADLVDLAVDGISAIETGKRKPSFETLGRIAAVLQIPGSDLDSAFALEYEQLVVARAKAPKSPIEAKAIREQQERMRKRHTER